MTSTAPYSEPADGAALSATTTCCSAPAASVNFGWLTLTPGIVRRRFGETLTAAFCTHGRGVTVMARGAPARFATVVTARVLACVLCSITAGLIDSPPSV